MNRSRVFLALGAALALALVPAAPTAVGAWLTASAPAVATASVGTATIPPLTSGAAGRNAAGAAQVSWADPGAARSYTASRSVNGVVTPLTPTVSVSDGVAAFTDDLTVAIGGGCATGWLAVGTDRCAPGATIPVTYTIGSTLRGWSPDSTLTVTATYEAPAVTGAPGPISRSGDELSASFTVQNNGSVPVTIRLETLLQPGGGGLIRFAVQPRGASGCTATHCWSENVVAAGATLPGIIDWRHVAAGTVLRITVSTPGNPDAVIEFTAP